MAKKKGSHAPTLGPQSLASHIAPVWALVGLLILMLISWLLLFSGVFAPATSDPNAIDPRVVPRDAPR